MNSFYEFKPEGSLWPLLLSYVESLIMYDRYVMTYILPTNAIILDLREVIKTASIIDYRAATNYPSNILSHWGGIIPYEFEQDNPDVQPLTNSSNSTKLLWCLTTLAQHSVHSSVMILN